VPTHLVAHLYFLQPHKAKQKNPKEPPSNSTKTAVNTDKQPTTEKNNEGITRVTVAQLHFQRKNPL
jgi:hypothetical protein